MSQPKNLIPTINDALLLHKMAYQNYINKHGSISKTNIDDLNKNFLRINIKRLILCKMIFEKKDKKDLDNLEIYVKKFEKITIQYLDILGEAIIHNIIKEELYLSSCHNANFIKERIEDLLKV